MRHRLALQKAGISASVPAHPEHRIELARLTGNGT